MEFGVTIPQGSSGTHIDYQTMKKTALECERLGFDSIYLCDHLVPRPAVAYPEKDCYPLDVPYFECWTALSALAVETDEVKLGSYTLNNSFRHPPSLLAKMSATLDNVCDGRFIFGIGIGYNEPEYIMYGVPFFKPSIRMKQLEEAIQIIKKMWTEERPSFKGKYFEINEAICNPKPVQKPHPPILIGGRRDLMLKTIANLADIWNWPPSVPLTPEIFNERCELLKRHCKSAGRKYENIVKCIGDICIISRNKSELKKGIIKYKPKELSKETYLKHLIGTPEQCIERMKIYMDLGASEFVISFPSLSTGDFRDAKLFAETIIPALKGN